MSEPDTSTAASAHVAAASERKITVRKIIDTAQVKIDLGYSLADFSAGLQQQASLFVYYGTLAAEASAQVDRFKLALETSVAKVYRILRDEAVAASEKVTEASLEKAVNVHPTVIALKGAINEAKQIEATTKIVSEAFRHRRDMLVQQGMLLVQEMKGEASISSRAAHAGEVEAQRNRVMEQIASTHLQS